MMASKKELVDQYFQQRQEGMELKKIRLELEGKGISAAEVSEVMAAINDKELESLHATKPSNVAGVALAISGVFFLSGVLLFFWMRSKGLESYQLLAVVPAILGIGSFLLFRQNKQKMDRRGTPNGGR